MKLIVVLCCLATPAVAQTRLEPAEVFGGAAYNLALRVPMRVVPKGRGILPRLVVFTTASLAYEVFVDPHHQMTDSLGRWTSTGQQRADIQGRQVGYLLMEAAVWGLLRLMR